MTHWVSKTKSIVLAALVVASGLLASARADYLDIDITGWTSNSGYGGSGNSSASFNLGAGTQITGFDYIAFSLTVYSPSYLNEFIFSVNNSDATGYMDWRPFSVNGWGTSAVTSGYWKGPAGSGGSYGTGTPFTLLADGILFVTVYELIPDTVTPDALVNSGTLRVYYTPASVPEPGTGLLVVSAMVGLGVFRRRARKA